MNMKLLVPAVLLALLAGLAVGFLGRPLLEEDPAPISRRSGTTETSGDTTPTKRQPKGDSTESGHRTEPATRPGPAPTTPPDTPAVIRPHPAETVSHEVAEAMSKFQPGPRPSGDGVISGSVTFRSNGGPVAGVQVAIRQAPVNPYEGEIRKPLTDAIDTSPEGQLRSRLEKMVEAERKWSSVTWTGMTAEDGRFSIGGLPDGEYTVSVTHPTYIFGERGSTQRYPQYYDPNSTTSGRAAIGSVVPGGEAHFVAEALRMVFVEVLNPDSTPASPLQLSNAQWPKGQEGASIEDVTPVLQFNSHQAWRGMGDYIVLVEGIHAVKPTLMAIHGLVKANPVRVDVLPDGPDPKVVIQLVECAGVKLKVTNEAGDLISDSPYYVNVVAAKNGEPKTSELTGYSGRQSMSPVKIRLGSAEAVFRDLDAGSYRAVLFQHSRVIDMQPVTISSGLAEVTLAVKPPARSEYVVVSVLGPDGQPLQDATVTARLKHKRGSTGSSQSTQLPDGTIMIYHAGSNSEQKYEEPVYSVRVNSKDYGMAEVEYQLGSAPEAVVKLQAPAMLKVVVNGAKGHPAADRLRVNLSGDQDMMLRGDYFGEYPGYDAYPGFAYGGSTNNKGVAGEFTFGPMQPGEVTAVLTISPSSSGWGGIELGRETVVLVPGQNEIRIQLPTLYTITVHAPDSKDGDSVSLRPVRDPSKPSTSYPTNSAKLGADLRCVFEHVPGGEYDLAVNTSGRRASERVRLPGPSTVTLAAPANPNLPSR